MGSQVIVIPNQSGTVSVAPIVDPTVRVVDFDAAVYEVFPWYTLGQVTPTAPEHRLYAEADSVVDTVRATVAVPSDVPIVVGFLLNGEQATAVTIPAGEYTGVAHPDTHVSRGDYFQLSVLQAGGTGSGLAVMVRLRHD